MNMGKNKKIYHLFDRFETKWFCIQHIIVIHAYLSSTNFSIQCTCSSRAWKSWLLQSRGMQDFRQIHNKSPYLHIMENHLGCQGKKISLKIPNRKENRKIEKNKKKITCRETQKYIGCRGSGVGVSLRSILLDE